MPANLTNVTFYGDDFYKTNPQNPNMGGGSGERASRSTTTPSSPPSRIPARRTTASCPANLGSTPGANCGSLVTCPQSYQYGIYNESGTMKGYTVEHSYFWGFGNAIDTAGSTQAAPQIFEYNFFSDAVLTHSCGYHTDGIRATVNTMDRRPYATRQITTPSHSSGNTNEIAWQSGTYSNITNTNNFMDGDNAMYAGARRHMLWTCATYILTTRQHLRRLPAARDRGLSDRPGGYATSRDRIDVESQLLDGSARHEHAYLGERNRVFPRAI